MEQNTLKKKFVIILLIIAMLVPYVPVFTKEVEAVNIPTIETVGGVVDYGYNGKIQEFIASIDGIYQLEVWGAQGGFDVSGGTKYEGGLGGYSKGNIKLKKGEKLYIAVGGKGVDCDYTIKIWSLDSNGNYLGPDETRPSGGWNGGGGTYFKGTEKEYEDPDDDGYEAWDVYEGGGGGGATSIQTSLIGDGQLKNYEANRSNVLIVAGGGGGGSTSPGWQEDDGYYSSSVSGAPGGGEERRRLYFYA